MYIEGGKKGGNLYCHGFLAWCTMDLLLPVWISSWYSDVHLHEVWALVFRPSATVTGVWWAALSFGGRNGSLSLPAFSLDSCVKFKDTFLYISVLKGSLEGLWTKTLPNFASLGSAVMKEMMLEELPTCILHCCNMAGLPQNSHVKAHSIWGEDLPRHLPQGCSSRACARQMYVL